MSELIPPREQQATDHTRHFFIPAAQPVQSAEHFHDGNTSSEITVPSGVTTNAPIVPTQESAPAILPLSGPAITITERPRAFVPDDSKHGLRPVNYPADDRDYHRVRDILTTRFASNTSGIDTQRAERCMRALGLPVTDSLFVDADSFKAIGRLLEDTFDDQAVHDEVRGFYKEGVNMIVMRRGTYSEHLYGPEYTESVFVHEQVHGSNRHNGMVTTIQDGRPQTGTPRVGQALDLPDGRSYGGFLEEGVAEYIRGRYIAEILKKPGGFADLPYDTVRVNMGLHAPRVPMPSPYITHNEKGSLGPPLVSAAGVAVKLLVQKDSALEAAFLQARTDVAGLREVAGRINAISDGLYQQLRTNFEAPSQYKGGLLHLMQVLDIPYK